MTVTVSVLVADVNELLRTIWQYLCVNMMLHAALVASWTRLILWLQFFFLFFCLCPCGRLPVVLALKLLML